MPDPLSSRMHDEAAVLYVTLPHSAGTAEAPKEVLLFAHSVHSILDSDFLSTHGLWKIAQDCSGSFVLASGLRQQQPSTERLFEVAQLLLAQTKQLTRPSGTRTGLRMAIHAGPTAAGVIGNSSLQYQLYGPMIDTACMASRQAKEHSVVITGNAWVKLKNQDLFAPTVPMKISKTTEVMLYEFCPHGPAQAGPSGASAAPNTSAAPTTQASQYWDLTYASSLLEKRFCGFFSAGQISVDLTFLMIVILSQASWIHRWTFHGSYLYGAMICLMSFNLLMVMAIVYCRDAYQRYREPLVMTSHLFHKIIQLVVTVAPQYGTIHSPSYSALVAILESSGCAGILMLCFGLRLRFCWQLVVGAATLGMSMAANRPVCSSNAFAGVNEGVCVAGMGIFQAVMVYMVPSLMVYALERGSRRRFMEAASHKTA